MAISPPSDIVLDVVKAADPQSVREAHTRLVNAGSAATETTFELANARPLGVDIRPSGYDSVPEPYREFEAMVLQSFIKSMLPEDATNTFGEGTAGDIWKGMMAEQLGRAVAESGGIGIAQQLADQAERAASAGRSSSTQAVNANQANGLVDQIQLDMLRDAEEQSDDEIILGTGVFKS